MAREFIHFLKYFAGFDAAQTQTTAAERETIKQYARGRKRCVEIGVFEGVTTGTIASILESDAVLYAIDPFIKGRSGICWGRPIAKREIARHRPKCQVRIVRAFSPEANKQIEGDFDFLFVDGDHSLQGIKQDWHDWSWQDCPRRDHWTPRYARASPQSERCQPRITQVLHRAHSTR